MPAAAAIVIGMIGMYSYLGRLPGSGDRKGATRRVTLGVSPRVTGILKGHVSRRPVSELRAPVSKSGVEQRKERRYLVEQSATLRVAAKRSILLVMIVDVSNKGLRVTCPEAFPTGTQITIQVRGLELRGEVRYAREIDPGEFHLGIKTNTANGAALLQLLSPNAA
jgi:hypothetical protein